VIYVGSAASTSYDQELDNVLVGPVPMGINQFVLQVRVGSDVRG
jgi:histone chaperone ASF1